VNEFDHAPTVWWPHVLTVWRFRPGMAVRSPWSWLSG
jgi:hypothetical protein